MRPRDDHTNIQPDSYASGSGAHRAKDDRYHPSFTTQRAQLLAFNLEDSHPNILLFFLNFKTGMLEPFRQIPHNKRFKEKYNSNQHYSLQDKVKDWQTGGCWEKVSHTVSKTNKKYLLISENLTEGQLFFNETISKVWQWQNDQLEYLTSLTPCRSIKAEETHIFKVPGLLMTLYTKNLITPEEHRDFLVGHNPDSSDLKARFERPCR